MRKFSLKTFFNGSRAECTSHIALTHTNTQTQNKQTKALTHTEVLQ